MPNINSVPEVLYEPNQPYHYYYDNLPLRNILTRIGLINIQVDTNADMIRGAAGSAGSIDSRLGVSLEADGSLKKASVDSSLHGIGHHEDGEGPDGVAYVRMTAEERAKLALVQSESNRLLLEIEDQFPTIGSYVEFTDGTLRLSNSSTIFFDFEAPNVLKAHSTFPPDVAHRHYYDRNPVAAVSPADYKNYNTTTLSTPYVEGSLRVYVNGVRLSDAAVPVPNLTGSSFTPTFIEYKDASTGSFRLNRAITGADTIRIDFDQHFFSSSSSSSSSSSGSHSSSSSAGSSSSADSSSSTSPEYSHTSSSSSEAVPSSSSSSSLAICSFIECGGSLAYADCGLAETPGYVSFLDCDLCECVDVPVSSSSSS